MAFSPRRVALISRALSFSPEITNTTAVRQYGLEIALAGVAASTHLDWVGRTAGLQPGHLECAGVGDGSLR